MTAYILLTVLINTRPYTVDADAHVATCANNYQNGPAADVGVRQR